MNEVTIVIAILIALTVLRMTGLTVNHHADSTHTAAAQ
jgi:hypothetical protein